MELSLADLKDPKREIVLSFSYFYQSNYFKLSLSKLFVKDIPPNFCLRFNASEVLIDVTATLEDNNGMIYISKVDLLVKFDDDRPSTFNYLLPPSPGDIMIDPIMYLSTFLIPQTVILFTTIIILLLVSTIINIDTQNIFS